VFRAIPHNRESLPCTMRPSSGEKIISADDGTLTHCTMSITQSTITPPDGQCNNPLHSPPAGKGGMFHLRMRAAKGGAMEDFMTLPQRAKYRNDWAECWSYILCEVDAIHTLNAMEREMYYH
jgi:hypothetical protein